MRTEAKIYYFQRWLDGEKLQQQYCRPSYPNTYDTSLLCQTATREYYWEDVSEPNWKNALDIRIKPDSCKCRCSCCNKECC